MEIKPKFDLFDSKTEEERALTELEQQTLDSYLTSKNQYQRFMENFSRCFGRSYFKRGVNSIVVNCVVYRQEEGEEWNPITL